VAAMKFQELLARLAAAQTDDERAWIVTENLLDQMSPDLRSITWAAAIPHWFDADILAALRPELRDRAAQIYTDLQTISFVEVFPERGHNIHELTRRLMLEHLWRENPDEFRALSARAAEYFARREENTWQIESVYHLIVAEPDKGADAVWVLGANLNNAFRFAELETLVTTLLEQVTTGRVVGRARAWIYFQKGRVAARIYRNAEALESFEIALEEKEDQNLRANVLKAMGDVQQFRDERDAALTNYAQALELFRAVGDRLGEANVLQSMGDERTSQKDFAKALEFYLIAERLYETIGDQYSASRNLLRVARAQWQTDSKGDAVNMFVRSAQIADGINVEFLRASALSGLADVCKELKDWSSLNQLLDTLLAAHPDDVALIRARGDALYSQKKYEEALAIYQRALALAPQDVGILNAQGNALESLKRRQEAIEAYSRAIELQADGAYLYRNRASDLLELGRLDEAEKDIARAVELQPDNAYTHGRQGYLALARGQFADALAHLTYSAEHDEDVGWQLGLALAHFANSNLDEAQKIITAALEKTDADQRESAREWLERIVRIEPELVDAAETLREMLK
jgi:tetratricopeptide (TPR) repeat protein